MEAAKFGPGDGLHFGGGIELHGAAPQGNHSAVERIVLIGKLLEVAHHLRLRTVNVEYRVFQIARGAAKLGGQCVRLSLPPDVTVETKRGSKRCEGAGVCSTARGLSTHLVERDLDKVVRRLVK